MLALLLAVVNVPSAEAAGRARLELFADPHAPITSQQQWLAQLSAAGITDLRIRTAQPTDKVGIEVLGGSSDPVYIVTGMITATNELVVPGRRFRGAEAPQLAAWLENLARKGLKQEEPPAAFGLTAQQNDDVQKDLAQTVGFTTKGIDRWQAVRKIGGRLAFPLRIPDRIGSADDKVADELSGLASGTSLACLLRPVGLGLVPRAAGRDGLEYRVVPLRKGSDAWPIGRAPEKPLPQLLPELYQSFNANVQDVPISRVLEAVAQRMKVPYLLDYNALALQSVNLDTKKVNSPQSRITYNQLLRKVLSQAGLRGEFRIDDGGKPFLWVTTTRPNPIGCKFPSKVRATI
jgi:hypothetical protein